MPSPTPSALPLIIFFGVIPFALLAYSLYDIYKKKYTGNNKLYWILILLLLPVLGPLLYLFVGKDKYIKE